MKRAPVDRIFLTIILILLAFGTTIYFSAVLGLFARPGISVASIAFNHVALGIILGLFAMWLFSTYSYKLLRKKSLIVYIITFLLTLLVFVPVIGIEHGGAKRWIDLGFVSFQPSEFLKLGYILYLAAWLSSIKDKVKQWGYGLLAFLFLSGLTGVVLLLQPDTDSFMILFFAGICMFVAAGARFLHVSTLAAVGVVLLIVMAFIRPYIMERFMTFLDPSRDPRGSGYQIQQSLIAIGSGGLTGRGLGQSIQKFNYLPEPIGDSIFAVAAEEFGFLGSVFLIMLFTAFGLRGLTIGSRSPDYFGRLVVVGFVILIVTQSFVNIGAMLGILPLSGLPLLFVSHGGTAMLLLLIECGIILSVSRKMISEKSQNI